MDWAESPPTTPNASILLHLLMLSAFYFGLHISSNSNVFFFLVMFQNSWLRAETASTLTSRHCHPSSWPPFWRSFTLVFAAKRETSTRVQRTNPSVLLSNDISHPNRIIVTLTLPKTVSLLKPTMFTVVTWRS